MIKISRHFIVFFMLLAIQTKVFANITQVKQEISDSLITTVIKGKITKDKDLNPLNISVTTNNGEVVLSGYVNDKASFVKTLKTATSTKGVKSIDASDLEIKRVNTSFTDAYITTKFEAAVLEAKVIDDESIPLVGINATTVNGVVTVSGTVKSSKSIAAILKRAHNIRGVKKIISNLEVKE
ncbi:MAG: ornithine racemase [Legionellales bacterium RIFCSPHIGHO2_12_FULL_35_11]|nr:MAG: ornithine racemase [Legionellales bacterium RIFCSPHIGHO2_12_FULL_35_11]